MIKRKLFPVSMLFLMTACVQTGNKKSAIKNDWTALGLKGKVKSLSLNRNVYEHGSDRDYKIIFNKDGFIDREFYYDNELDENPNSLAYYDKYLYSGGLLVEVDEYNNVDKSIVYMSDGSLTAEHGIDNNVNNKLIYKTLYKYDDNGNRVEEREEASDGQFVSDTKYQYIPQNVLTFTFECDSQGNVVNTIFTTPSKDRIDKNENGDVTLQVEYDEHANVESQYESNYEYDAIGNWIKSTTVMTKKKYDFRPITVMAERRLKYYDNPR